MATKKTKTILVIDDESQQPIESNIRSVLKAEFELHFINVDALQDSVLDNNLNVDQQKLLHLIQNELSNNCVDLILTDYDLGNSCPITGLNVIEFIRSFRSSIPIFLYSVVQKDLIKEVVGDDLNGISAEQIINSVNVLMDLQIAKICSRPSYPEEVIKYLRNDSWVNPRSILVSILRTNQARVFNSCCPPLAGKTFAEVATILEEKNNGLATEWMQAIMEQIAAYLVEINE